MMNKVFHLDFGGEVAFSAGHERRIRMEVKGSRGYVTSETASSIVFPSSIEATRIAGELIRRAGPDVGHLPKEHLCAGCAELVGKLFPLALDHAKVLRARACEMLASAHRQLADENAREASKLWAPDKT